MNEFSDFFKTPNLEEFTSIYYAREFCIQLVEDTIDASYYLTSYVRRYLNNIVALMKCETSAVENPQFVF